MKLKEKDLNYLSQVAISAAMRAGKIIQAHVNKQVNHRLKTGVDNLAAQIVTEVDFLAQEIILDALSESCQLYDLAILTEESEDNKSRFNKDYFWCIDPLDGTLYFSESEPGYSVSIALVSKAGVSILGVIYDPYEDRLYTSIQGHNRCINQKPINITPEINNKKLSIFCDRHYLQDKEYIKLFDKLCVILEKKDYQLIEICSKGGAVKNAMAVLDHFPACYFKLPKQPFGGGSVWDYAASSYFFHERGAIVTDIRGNKLDLNPSGSLYLNHSGIVFASNQEIADSIYQLVCLG